MSDPEGALPPSKKRVAGREISKENPGLDDDDVPEGEMGTFKRASEDVLAGRRMVKVRRQPAKPTSTVNPFAGLQLLSSSKAPEGNAVHATVAARTPEDNVGIDQESDSAHKDAESKSKSNIDVEAPVQENTDKVDKVSPGTNGELERGVSQEAVIQKEDDKEAGEKAEPENNPEKEAVTETKEEQSAGEENKEAEREINKESENPEDLQKDAAEAAGPFSSFQQLSSRQNAFTGLVGTGFSSGSFSFGLASKEGSAFGAGSGSLFGQSGENLSRPSIGIGNSSSGSSLQLFASTGSEATSGGGWSKPLMQEVVVETGEENENAVFNADAILFEYLDGGWKERGKGELKVNVPASGSGKARLVMRARGNYRLILNANLFQDISLKSMEKKGVTFACINSASEGKDGFATFALKFKEASILEDFRGVVETYKSEKDDVEEEAPPHVVSS